MPRYYLDYSNYLLFYKKIWTEEDHQIIAEYTENLYERYGEPKCTGPVGWDDEPTKYECDHNGCNKSYRRKEALDKHVLTHAKTVPEFGCQWKDCGKTFRYKSNLENHVRFVHLKERHFVCAVEECGRKFANQNKLTMHTKQCHHKTNWHVMPKNSGDQLVASTEEPVLNDTESAGVKAPEEEEKPEEEKTGSDKTPIATITLRRSPRKDKKHLTTNDGTVDSPKKARGEPSAEEGIVQIQPKKKKQKKVKEFKCTWPKCDKAFNYKNYMLNHRAKVHLKMPTRYRCDWNGCHKKFVWKSTFQVHKKCHLGLKPFECEANDCDKKFLMSSQLYKHILSCHSNVKTHKCSNCSKVFFNEHGLNIHTERMHKYN